MRGLVRQLQHQQTRRGIQRLLHVFLSRLAETRGRTGVHHLRQNGRGRHATQPDSCSNVQIECGSE